MALLRFFDKVHDLVVHNRAGNRLRMEEPSVDEEVEERGNCDSTKLVSTDAHHLAKLLLAFASFVLIDLFLGFVLETTNFLFL